MKGNHIEEYFAFYFTIFCIVGVTNAFNWIDGIDGFFSSQVLKSFWDYHYLSGRIISIPFIIFISYLALYCHESWF